MKHNKNKNKNKASEIEDDPQAQVLDLLNNFPDIASDLYHLLHLIDSGKAVDITSISHKSLINPLRKLFLSLNLNQLSSHDGGEAFILPQDSPLTLDLIGSVFSTRSEEPVVVGPDLPEKKKKKKKKKKKPVVGPGRPSEKLLAAAAKLQEAQAALREAEQEQEQDQDKEFKEDKVGTSLIGPTQPERFEQVTRILLLVSDDVNVKYCYDVLGVQQHQHRRSIMFDEIKRKYLKLSLLVHPDKCSHPRANEAFVKVNEAFRELSDPVRRRAVDDRIEDKEKEEERLRAMRGGGGGESERARKAKRDYLRARNVLASLASDEERKKEKRKRGKEKEEEEEEWVGKHPWRPWDREKDWEGGKPSVKLDSEDLYEGVWSQF